MDDTAQKLVADALRGDSAAYGLLVQRYYNWVCGIAFHILKDINDVQDVAQDVFMDVFKNLSQLRELDKFELWLRIITINRCKMRLRSRREIISLEDIPPIIQTYITYPERDDYQFYDMLMESLKSLPDNNQLVMKLHYVDNMSYKEIAVQLDVPVTTVEGRLHRAREQLREEFLDMVGTYYARKRRKPKRAININGALIDPETGMKYTRLAVVTGKNDIVQYPTGLNLSSNASLLLWGVTVVPLNEDEPFNLIDFFGSRGVWSPDMSKLVFYSNGIWLIEFSPDTSIPIGEARKILEGEYWFQHNVDWSPDSKKIAFTRDGNIWTLSVDDLLLTQVTKGENLKLMPLWSHDGKKIAYSQDYMSVYFTPSQGGEPKLLINAGRHIAPVCWVDDDNWLLCGEGTTLGTKLSLISGSNGDEIVINPPLEAGKFLLKYSTAKDNKILLCRLSYDYRSTLRVLSASGGLPMEFCREHTLWAYTQFWTPDSKTIITGGENSNEDYVFWVVPLSGGRPEMVEIMQGAETKKPIPYLLSPNLSKLLFSDEKKGSSEELWVANFSLDCYKATPPFTLIYIWEDRHPADMASWSPDGTRLAIMHKGEIWVVAIDGSPPYQLTKPPGWKHNPVWSPDSQMIAYNLFLPDRKGGIYIIPSSGGEGREILGTPGSYRSKYAFSKKGGKLFVINNDLMVVGISVTDGKTREIADLKEFDINQTHSLSCSPDGTKLALVGWNRPKDDAGAIYVVPINGGKIQKFASEDTGYKESITWSPDGKWISYSSDVTVKTRPESVIWETDLGDVLKKRKHKEKYDSKG